MHRTTLTLALTGMATLTAAQDGPLQVNIDLAASLETRTCAAYLDPEKKTILYQLLVGAAMAESRNETELAYAIEIFNNNVLLCAIKTPERPMIAVMRETVTR